MLPGEARASVAAPVDTTLFDLVEALASEGATDAEADANVAALIESGRIRRVGKHEGM